MDVDSPGDWTGGIAWDEIRTVWAGQLRPVPTEVVAAQTPPDVREFLTRIGLPDVDIWGITFAHDERLSHLVPSDERDYLLLTQPDSTTTFGIDVATGQVFKVALDLPKYTRFFNSDIAAFLYFLGLVKANVLDLEEATMENLPDAVTRVREALRARDPAAVEGETSWNAWLDELVSYAE
jgi:hypothetical protein